MMVDRIRIFNKTVNNYIDLDKYSAMFLLDDEGIDWDAATPTINTYPSIYGLGSKVSNVTFQRDRKITITGWIINDNAGTIAQKKRLLNQFVNPLNEIQVQVISKYYISGIFANSVKYTNKRKENNDTVCKFQLNIVCSSPFFRLLKPIVYKDIKWNVGYHHYLHWKGWELYINNTSGVEHGFELYVKLDEGIITPTFSVSNATADNGKSTYIASGETVEDNIYLNTTKGSYSFGNVDTVPTEDFPEDFDRLNISASDFEFVQLVPGINRIQISCGMDTDTSENPLGNSTLDFYFSPILLGFEEM